MVAVNILKTVCQMLMGDITRKAVKIYEVLRILKYLLFKNYCCCLLLKAG